MRLVRTVPVRYPVPRSTPRPSIDLHAEALAESFPQYAVSKWIGHSITVSGKHYANNVPDELFTKAAGIAPADEANELAEKAAQNQAQYGAEQAGMGKSKKKNRPVLPGDSEQFLTVPV